MNQGGILSAIGAALSMAFAMGWEILWALVLGFTLSGVVQAAVIKGEMARLLPDSRPRSILIASGLGAASSSCSYAAVALVRSIFRKGGDFSAAMAFQFASTNLVVELGIILWVLMGWQFTAAEFVGGPIMIVLLVVLLRMTMTQTNRTRSRIVIAGLLAGFALASLPAFAQASTPALGADQGSSMMQHGMPSGDAMKPGMMKDQGMQHKVSRMMDNCNRVMGIHDTE